MTVIAERVGRKIEVNHAASEWDGLKGEVVGESQYGFLSVNIGSSDWRGGIWPFLPEEVRFINQNGGRR